MTAPEATAKSAPRKKVGTAEDYTASNLQVLEGLDAVRKRPGMYVGSTDSRGLQVLLWESVDNSIDEAIAGFCTNIEVTLHQDGSLEVVDNGRGIPIDKERTTGLPGVIVVFTVLHAGGKFGGGSYEASGGLHGVGASVLNALSTRVDVEVKRGGKIHAISFSRGIAGHFDAKDKFTESNELKVIGKSKDTGTRVRYWPDRSIFLQTATFDFETVQARLRQSAFLVPGLEIKFSDERGEDHVVETYKYDGGMKDFVDFLATDRPLTDTFVIQGKGRYSESVPVLTEGGIMVTQDVEREMDVEVALRWGVGYETTIKSFVNIVQTYKGGTHVSGFDRALKRAVNDALKTLKVQKATDDPVEREDIQEGLTAVVLVRISEPQFEGQTKEILGTSAASGIVNQVVTEGLKGIFNDAKQRQQVKTVLEKINQAMKTRKAARLHKETIRRKTALESSSMPAKLADCRSEDLSRTELFIIEGDSAAGTLKGARNSEFQALLPIRGKILNTLRATEKQMLDNAECAAIITAMGAGSGKSFDLESIRYGRFIITADADVDGSHIRCLLLTLCYRYMRPLLENGHVFAAVPPLYRDTIKGSGEQFYSYTAEDRAAKIAAYEAAGKTINYDKTQRYKGLGEMDADQLAETTIDPTKRRLRQLTLEDAEEALQVFEMLMGSDVTPRRNFIIEHGGLLDPDKLDI